MLQVEVFIAPALVTGVVIGAVRRERSLANLAKMAGIFFEGVARREIEAAAEPEYVRFIVARTRRRQEHADIHVRNGHVGVARMQYQRHAHGLPRPARKLGPVCARRRRQFAAVHMAEQYAGPLEQLAALDQARYAASAFGPLP